MHKKASGHIHIFKGFDLVCYVFCAGGGMLNPCGTKKLISAKARVLEPLLLYSS